MKKYLILSLVGVLAISTFATQAGAQTIAAPTACTILSQNLTIGRRGSDVVVLQNYLISKGYMTHVATGYFGALTYQAVVAYQSTHSLPMTGYVGPMTRTAIQAESCGTNPVPPQPLISVQSVTPSAAAVGTIVSLTGTGFSPVQNTVVFKSSTGAYTNIEVGGLAPTMCTMIYPFNCVLKQTLQFAVPAILTPYCPAGMYCTMAMQQVTPGSYTIHIQNTNGTSNAVPFTVSGTSNQTISINSLQAPNSLPMGTTGTWTLNVTAPQSTQMTYSVIWGDEQYGVPTIAAPQMPTTPQTSATFQHTYTRAGTYNPVFTVTDIYGNKATTSATVVVTPWY